jgi:uncharacterized protein (TIGR00725 family)
MKKSIAIAIFSSAKQKVDEELNIIAEEIGVYLAKKKIKVVTGGSLGIPALVVKAAKHNGGETMAFFPDHDPESHGRRFDNQSTEFFDTFKFIPGFTKRSLAMIGFVDAAIVLNGRMGTLSEITMAIEEGLIVGIVQGTGGISDLVPEVLKISNKEICSKVILSDDYKEIIDQIIISCNK